MSSLNSVPSKRSLRIDFDRPPTGNELKQLTTYFSQNPECELRLFGGGKIWADLSFLGKLIALRKLSLENMNSKLPIADLTVTTRFNQLVSLNISGCVARNLDLSPLLNHRRWLKKLNILTSPIGEEDHDVIGQLTQLTSLGLTTLPVHKLEKLKRIREVYVGSGKLEEPERLRSMKIKRITLNGSSVTSISTLLDLRSLEEFVLLRPKKVESCELPKRSNVKFLYVDWSGLTGVERIGNFSNLLVLILRQCQFNPEMVATAVWPKKLQGVYFEYKSIAKTNAIKSLVPSAVKWLGKLSFCLDEVQTLNDLN